MSSSALEEILSERKILPKVKTVREKFLLGESSKGEKRRDVNFDEKIKEISHLSDNLISKYLQIVEDSLPTHSKVTYPQNFHKLYTFFSAENSNLLEKLVRVLAKYELSPFFFEEGAKILVEQLEKKPSDEIKYSIELISDLAKEDYTKFSIQDLGEINGEKKISHLRNLFSIVNKLTSTDLEEYITLHRRTRELVKHNDKYKHIIRNFLYRLIKEDNLENKLSALDFTLDVCEENKNISVADFELFFKVNLICGDEKTREWYVDFVKSADSRLKPALTYLREAVKSKSEADFEQVLQNIADLLSLYSFTPHMIRTINEKTGSRQTKMKCQEIDSLISIIRTIETEAIKREETTERIQECARVVMTDMLKEESHLHRVRLKEVFDKYNKEVCSRFRGEDYIDSISQLFSSEDSLLKLSNEALTAVYAAIDANKKAEKRTSKKEIVKATLRNLEEDISRTRTGAKETKLSQSHKTLEIYANMIAGRNYSVRIEEGVEPGMKHESDNNVLVMQLPSVISYFKEDEKNNILFRALATILAGHARYSSGKCKNGSFVNVSEISQKFENPDLYKFILQLSESHRIKSNLSTEYPGFAEDLTLLTQYLSKLLFQNAFTNTEQDDPKRILRQLVTQSFYKSGEGRNEKIDEALFSVESQNASFEDSLKCSKAIYSLIKNPEKIILKPEEKKFAITSIEQIVSALENVKPFISESKSATVQFTYPEFDFKKGHLVERVTSVRLVNPPMPKFVPKIFADFDESVLFFVKEQLEHLKPSEKDRIYGSKGVLDMARFQNWKAQRIAGVGALANDIFVQPVYNIRNVATAIAIEHSGSTKRFVGEQKQRTFVADYMKRLTQHLIGFMDVLGDDAALYAYQGVGAHNVQCTTLLDFGEEFSLESYKSLAALESKGNNRDGAIIRHVGNELSQHPANTRVLLNITDGIPHDEGYEGEYAFADVRMACRELEHAGIIPIRLIVDPTLTKDQIKSFEDEYTLVLANFNEALKRLPFLYYDKTK